MASVQRARAAYQDAQYMLSVSLFEECLADMKPSAEIYLDYADALVQCGRLLDSLDVFALCSRYTSVSTDRLKHVVTTFMEMLSASGLGRQDYGGLGCVACEGVPVQPVTLGCGHTLCGGCARDTKVCRKCNVRVCGVPETNVLVKKVVERWFGAELRAAWLREEGNKLCQGGKFEEAVTKYSAALDHGESTLLSSSYTVRTIDKQQTK